MTTERRTSTETAPSVTRSVIEILAGLSGVFLLVAYISGRIYLQAYYSTFHTELSDLDLSIQDIMFQSRWSLLGPGASLVVFVVSMPWLRSLALAQRRHEAVATQVRDIRSRFDAMSERIAADKLSFEKRIAAGTVTAAEIDESAQAITAELTTTTADAEAATRELDSIDHAFATASAAAAVPLPSRLEKPLVVLGRFLWLWLTVLWALAVLATALIVGTQQGGTSALYAAAATASLIPVIGFSWLGRRFSDAEYPRLIDYLAGLCLGAYFVLAVPFLTGLSLGRMSKYADEPGTGLPTIAVTADRPLDSSWTASGSDFVSPKLRLLGHNQLFIVVWNPGRPDKSYSIPLSDIRSIERGR